MCCLFFIGWQEVSLPSAVDNSNEFLQPSADGAVASDTNSSQRLVIWGTDVNVGTCKEKFQVWDLRSFTDFPQHERLRFHCCPLWAPSRAEVPAEIHWPQFQRRRERWSGSEWATVHAETGGGTEITQLSVPLTVSELGWISNGFFFSLSFYRSVLLVIQCWTSTACMCSPLMLSYTGSSSVTHRSFPALLLS